MRHNVGDICKHVCMQTPTKSWLYNEHEPWYDTLNLDEKKVPLSPMRILSE